jgi:AraC family transcriptional regulator
MVQINARQQLTEHSPSSPQTGVLHSSEALGWRGIVVEQRYHPAGEYCFSYPSFHMICLHQDRPLSVEQVRNGRTLNHMMTRGSVQIVTAGTETIWRHQKGSHNMHVLLAPEVLQHVAQENRHHHRTELLDLNSIQGPRIEHISTALLTEVLEGGISGR